MFCRLLRVARIALLVTAGFSQLRVAVAQVGEPGIEAFFALVSTDPEAAAAAREEISAGWRDGYTGMLVDLLDILRRTGFVDPRGFVQLAMLTEFLADQTGQEFGMDVDAWRRWVWASPYQPHSAYGEFKGALYANLDPGFADFFAPPVESSIRLDEIQWGGVGVNGIPPLDHPETVPVDQADFMGDGDIVFGVVVAGESRAYPKRILAWHELALDRVGGLELTAVYCTLCGTMVPYLSEVGGVHRIFGTSGLLYQSNKLMFDAGTNSLWSSLTGEPVVGPLVGSGLQLMPLPVVTTTWGEWRERHPETTVLSLDTGHLRDYSEGAAYRAYFSTDALMFDVSSHDQRLDNKAEVLVLRAIESAYAIAAAYLAERPVYQLEVEGQQLVVLTSPAGANRVYLSDGRQFDRLEGDQRLVDSDGRDWRVGESFIEAEFDAGLRLPRVPAHRAFWFGWYAQHPDTVLIH